MGQGHQHNTTSTPERATQSQAGLVQGPGPGQQGAQNRVGNAAVGTGLDGSATSCSCSDPAVSWRASGNLIGNPPVRDEQRVPNKCVVEDQAVYTQRRAIADRMLARQRDRTRRGGELMDADGNVTDYRYWFAKVYSFVTQNELDFTDQRTYFYPSYVMASVAYFEQIYADNYAAFSSGATVEDHWRQAFERAAQNQAQSEMLREMMLNPPMFSDPSGQGGVAMAYLTDLVLGAVDSLVASMQAHIRFDLPRAEAWVFNTYYAGMGCVSIQNFRQDFMAMAGVFDNAGRQMNEHMAEVIGLPVDVMPKILQDTTMAYGFDADMSTERADTWQRAEDLVAQGEGAGPYTEVGGQLVGNVTAGNHTASLQRLPNAGLRPSMEASAPVYDDDDSRRTVSSMTDAELAAMPLVEKMRRIRGMIRGLTLDADEDTILRILRVTASNPSNLVVLVNGSDAWDILTSCHGAQYREVRTLLRQHYYANTDQNTAIRLIQIGIEGVTGATSAELIGDILDRRLSIDGKQIIVRIGRQYGDAGPDDAHNYREGRDELLWQVAGWPDAFIRQNYPETYTP